MAQQSASAMAPTCLLYHDKVGAAAWKIENPTSHQAIEGTTRTAGEPLEVDSYRSELAPGVYAMLLGLLAFCTYYKIPDGKVTLGCNNATCVHLSRGNWLKIKLRSSNCDLLHAIQIIKAKLPIQVVFVHVRGHQDDLLLFSALTQMEQLNVEMDDKAKSFLRTVLADDQILQCPSTIAYEGWQCYMLGRKLTSDPGPPICLNVFGSKLLSKLVNEGRITLAAFQNINWAAINRASSTFPPLYQLWVAKHVSGFFSIGHMMKNWKFWDHSRCPFCDHEDETKEHLLTCPHPDCASTWSASLAGFEAWMMEVDTAPAICTCLLQTNKS
jgi:hypothetical protein